MQKRRATRSLGRNARAWHELGAPNFQKQSQPRRQPAGRRAGGAAPAGQERAWGGHRPGGRTCTAEQPNAAGGHDFQNPNYTCPEAAGRSKDAAGGGRQLRAAGGCTTAIARPYTTEYLSSRSAVGMTPAAPACERCESGRETWYNGLQHYDGQRKSRIIAFQHGVRRATTHAAKMH